MHGITCRALTLLLFQLPPFLPVLQIILAVASLVGKTPKSVCKLRVSVCSNLKLGTRNSELSQRTSRREGILKYGNFVPPRFLWSMGLLGLPVIAQERIKLDYSSVDTSHAAWYVAQELGFFKKYGLDSQLILIPSTTTAVSSISPATFPWEMHPEVES